MSQTVNGVKPGDRVKFTLTGTARDQDVVDGVGHRRTDRPLIVEPDEEYRSYLIPIPVTRVADVEVIEPVYLHGVPYMDANGVVWEFDSRVTGNRTKGRGWWKRFGQCGEYGFATPVRPLRRLVPE